MFWVMKEFVCVCVSVVVAPPASFQKVLGGGGAWCLEVGPFSKDIWHRLCVIMMKWLGQLTSQALPGAVNSLMAYIPQNTHVAWSLFAHTTATP